MMEFEGGKNSPHESIELSYRKDVKKNAVKFEEALMQYQEADLEKKVYFKSLMDEKLALIRASSLEIKKAGVHKQEVKLEHHFQAYINAPTEEHLSALRQDLETLKEYFSGS